MNGIDWETVKDMFRFWYHAPDAFIRAYDKGVINHTREVEMTHEVILSFGSDDQKGGEIWQDKTKYQ